jgi:hypothetical protein
MLGGQTLKRIASVDPDWAAVIKSRGLSAPRRLAPGLGRGKKPPVWHTKPGAGSLRRVPLRPPHAFEGRRSRP